MVGVFKFCWGAEVFLGASLPPSAIHSFGPWPMIIFLSQYRYVPALRLLRQQAFVLTFPHTIPGRLAQRLMEVICPTLSDLKTAYFTQTVIAIPMSLCKILIDSEIICITSCF